METRPLRLGGIGQLFPEFLPEARVPRVELICPQPRRAVRVPSMLDCGGLGSMAKCIFSPLSQEHKEIDFLGMFFDKGEPDDDFDINSNQNGFFCGSPPARTSNPVVWDAQFAEENSSGAPPNAARVERSHRSCSSSFDARSDPRTEGFIITRANPGPGLVVSARS